MLEGILNAAILQNESEAIISSRSNQKDDAIYVYPLESQSLGPILLTA